MVAKFIYLDGAMGTTLQKKGLKLGGLPEELNITDRDMVKSVHQSFIDTGSQIIYTNTFGANARKMIDSKYSIETIVQEGLKIAREAVEGTNCKVALDIGPIGEMMEPIGTLSFDDAYELFRQQVIAGKKMADLIVIETMSDLLEVKTAILAAKENSKLPIFVTMTFEEDHHTYSGTYVKSFGAMVEGLGVEALGINCSLGPKEIYPIIKDLAEVVTLPLIVKANAGLPHEDGSYSMTPREFAEQMREIGMLGVQYLGGCCGTTPEFIKELIHEMEQEVFPGRKNKRISAVASATKYLPLEGIHIIGERINPTGKPRLKESLVKNSMEYILSLAVSQVDEGAEILDVNLGLPGIDEAERMKSAVLALSGVPDVPLQLDSSNPEVLETGLRVIAGKAIVNSVNGSEESIRTILPLVKRYGAMVIGLTLDEDGIPDTALERMGIAKKIITACKELGIPKEDVIIDPLAMAISSEPMAAKVAIETIQLIKRELGVKTTLGVSNISFGLPRRDIINSNFLQAALMNGLDLPIMNPSEERMKEIIYTYHLLEGEDLQARNFIEKYSEQREESKKLEKDMTPYEAMSQGQKLALEQIVKNWISNRDELEIINEELIPALDRVGEDYEKGKIYLPQLIGAASVAQSGFAILRDSIMRKQEEQISGGKIVLATVQGDIHDIGKNIVKVILENYGYDIFDLGKDVAPEKILETVLREDIKLVGLSALMTTTVDSMKRTIELLQKNVSDITIMAGGAVLTEEFAKSIGADYYVKDAKEDVTVAREVLGGVL